MQIKMSFTNFRNAWYTIFHLQKLWNSEYFICVEQSFAEMHQISKENKLYQTLRRQRQHAWQCTLN